MSTRAKWLERLAKVECPDTTWISRKFPTVLKKGKGIVVTDVENKKYLDFTAAFGVLALGHRPQVTLKALKKQSSKLIHGMGDVHPNDSKIRLLELLAKISPYSGPKTLLGMSGGDAIEIAMKTAILATGRSQFISFDSGYHGVQLAPLNLNHTAHFQRGFENLLTNHALYLPFPHFEENGPKGIGEKIEEPAVVLEMLEKNLKTKLFAALILEPIQGRGGVRIFSKNFLEQCQSLCQKYGTLLVFDEIMTGFGRTGTMFAYEHSQVVPDLMCVGKAMGGGFPISACIGNMMDAWEVSKGEARHTQTFLGHPISCAVAHDTILEIQKKLPEFQKEIPKIEKQLNIFSQNLNDAGLTKEFPCFVRGKGFMHGLFFYSRENEFGPELMQKLFSKGFFTLPEGSSANVMALMPPLNTTATEYKKILNAVSNILGCVDTKLL